MGHDLANRAGTVGRTGNEQHRHRGQTADRAAGVGSRTWQAHHGRAVVSGFGCGAAVGADSGARLAAGKTVFRAGAGSIQGNRVDQPAAYRRTAINALVADAGCAQKKRRVVCAQFAAGHAGFELAHRAGRPKPGAGRFHCGHADLGDPVQAPGRNRYPPFSRCAARLVFHQHWHDAGLAAGTGALAAGAALGDAARAIQAVFGNLSGARFRRYPRRVTAHRALSGTGGRIWLCAFDFGGQQPAGTT